jgi:hypothetical protein
MPGRDPVTGVTHEQTVAELQAELAIANEHLKALLKQNELLKEALNEKLRPSAGSSNPNAPQTPPPQRPQAARKPEDEEDNPRGRSSGPPPDPFRSD